jgi:hypothetical protein
LETLTSEALTSGVVAGAANTVAGIMGVPTC